MGFKALAIAKNSKDRNDELNSVFCICNFQFLRKLIYIAPKSWNEALVSHCLFVLLFFQYFSGPNVGYYFIFASASHDSMS